MQVGPTSVHQWATAGLAAVALCLAGSAGAQADERDISPDAALTRMLAAARAELPETCDSPAIDRLAIVLCADRIRIGVRADYPPFAVGAVRRGYEVDLARTIASRLGVKPRLVTVTSGNRLFLLGENRVDVVIATLGHNDLRDGTVRFIRPHYYRSETVIVGPRDIAAAGWADLVGRTVCVTIGNVSNAELSSHAARLMLFDGPERLLDELKAGTCTLIAQDDSFFAASFAEPRFAALYNQKFGFAPVPWGMAVAQTNGDRLAQALSLISQILLRDGTLASLARTNGIATEFFEVQQRIWQRPDCNIASGSINPACVMPPAASHLEPTRLADRVADVEAWVHRQTGITLTLPMLTTVPGWEMFETGLINSLLLVAGTIAATLACAVGFGALLGSRAVIVRYAVRIVTITLQSSPTVLTLVVAGTVANAVAVASSWTTLATSIVALGLTNGSHAGQAISEALRTLRAEAVTGGADGTRLFARALSRSAGQIIAFVVNATKATPIASFIGAPELLSALTDITSFSSERGTTYWVLLIFYSLIVVSVLWLCAALRSFLERRRVQT
jgi:polar amino acid transport system substrate-binding protein